MAARIARITGRRFSQATSSRSTLANAGATVRISIGIESRNLIIIALPAHKVPIEAIVPEYPLANLKNLTASRTAGRHHPLLKFLKRISPGMPSMFPT
jgi:hypothetical protein